MQVLEPPITDQDLWLEIQPIRQSLPTAAADLAPLGLTLTGQSRILSLTPSPQPLAPDHLRALSDPLTERVLPASQAVSSLTSVDVLCKPGVTDAEGEMAARALALVGLSEVTCRAGTRFRFAGTVESGDRDAVERLLGNPLIHHFRWNHERSEYSIGRVPASQARVELIDLRAVSEAELLAISRANHLALDLAEMRAIAGYFRRHDRAATDVELQSIALAWSEHCSHKTFKAPILFEHDGDTTLIAGLLATCIAGPTAQLDRSWVRSAFVDNAGVIAFDGKHDLAFKVETHNHPSALEPFGGAHTGVGGVIRDILAVSAEPIANTDVLCFGPPDLPADDVPAGSFHPSRTAREVVRGIAAYGNNMGIPTVGGAILFDRAYTANPLVYCGTLGIAPRGSHPRDPRPGDRVVILGGRTGRDGLHGATMSSETLDRESVAASAVQIGAPITEKGLRDVLPRLRDERLYHAITDCGAGGLCSAVGEMGETRGVELDLALVPLKYTGLAPWEIWLSEAQERMVLAVPDVTLPRLLRICREHDVEATVAGTFRSDGMLLLSHREDTVAELDLAFLHGGRPERVLQACHQEKTPLPYPAADCPEAGDWLLRLLSHPDIASKEAVIRRYDHEVGAGTIVKPLTAGGGPSDAAVLRPLPPSRRGAVLAHGINQLYGALDPHAMAMLAVDEALRNLVAVGGSIDRAALLDNFCWGDVDDPEELGALVRAAQGCHDAALTYGTPFISGKDSLRNTSVEGGAQHGIPGTLLISALGVIPDTDRCVTSELTGPGNLLYLLGETRDELGGSHYLVLRDEKGGLVPRVRPEETPRLMRRLTRAIRRGLVRACHDLSEGGLAVAAAEMSLASGCGLALDLDRMPAACDAPAALLFAESPGRFLVEVLPEQAEAFERLFDGLPHARIGETTASARFLIRHCGSEIVDLPVSTLDKAWRPEEMNATGGRSAGCSASAPSSQPAADFFVEPSRDVGRGVPARLPLPNDVASLAQLQPPVGAPSLPRRSAQRSRRPSVLVLAAAGVNCDRESVEACRLAGASPQLIHLNLLIAREVSLLDFAMLILPGGFSYGDHLGAGAMLATVLRHHLAADLDRLAASGRPILGICNGFQILSRLGLLGDVSLMSNLAGRFECRWVSLRVEPSNSLFLRGLERLELPIAHGEGRVAVPDEALAGVLSRAPLRYETNPNGSVAGIAGIANAAGNVLGLMPHPERYVRQDQHPAWRSGEPAGLAIFRNAVRYIREEL